MTRSESKAQVRRPKLEDLQPNFEVANDSLWPILASSNSMKMCHEPMIKQQTDHHFWCFEQRSLESWWTELSPNAAQQPAMMDGRESGSCLSRSKPMTSGTTSSMILSRPGHTAHPGATVAAEHYSTSSSTRLDSLSCRARVSARTK
eukprot:CAMPEP_0206487148 /NCGR_PEP_ID=MMETSP0324_2-20121206/41448_1 /ASSEMBLY_ACC=CAM_ASM_000836 /TAXON_ID=2866 /ORGANISM="Crypthecodinium cohnii, Strain Seligo" /LENGTH=146 /DNA_ID=CAMNT_0053965533 /DNA_START=90 /DNA_END=528 /DNA_ORIENTATION=+